MSTSKRAIRSLIVALAVGFGMMAVDKWRGAEWAVSPARIAEAKAQGKAGVESSPGSVVVLPIRKETADVLPLKWALFGLGAGALTFFSGRKRRSA